MFGSYGEGKQVLPRVLHITLARYSAHLPQSGKPLEFLLTIHEEGTGISWQKNVEVPLEIEKDVLTKTKDLYFWSLNQAFTPKKANETVHLLGSILYKAFIGEDGESYLSSIQPTAILFDVDETILNVPWELIQNKYEIFSQTTPFGRIVSTRTSPKPGRDPIQEDKIVRILVVANPTMDLAESMKELDAIRKLEREYIRFSVKVDVLSREEATIKKFKDTILEGDYDILHFAGHASFDLDQPENNSLYFADGLLSANEVLDLPWKQPPYFVFNSACESGRAAGGMRLISEQNQCNGLAAAFLTTGVYGYAGYFWPVTDHGASFFSEIFYKSLFFRENVGLAFLDARKRTIEELGGLGDLTGYSAILFGDAASKHRRDLAESI